MDVLHVVVEGGVVGHPPVLAHRHILLLPLLKHGQIRYSQLKQTMIRQTEIRMFFSSRSKYIKKTWIQVRDIDATFDLFLKFNLERQISKTVASWMNIFFGNPYSLFQKDTTKRPIFANPAV